jgi:hypothetical protein
MVMVFWSMVTVVLFFVKSFLVSTKQGFPWSVYFIALGLFVIHLVIRSIYPAKFPSKSSLKNSPERAKEIFVDIIIKFCFALSSSVTVFAIFRPDQVGFFLQLQGFIRETVFGFFVHIVVMTVLFLLVPLGFIWLRKTSPPLARKLLLPVTYLNIFFIILITVDLIFDASLINRLTRYLLEKENFIIFVKFVLGAPLIFWLRSLFLGVVWIKTD